MQNYLLDLSNMILDSELINTLKQSKNVGILFNSSYFKNDTELKKRLNLIKELGLNNLICLRIDCPKNKILGVEPHLQIFDACNRYHTNPKRAKEIIRENACITAHKFLKHGIDIYISPILSFSDDILNSALANENFINHNIQVISEWINALNTSGMLCCIEPSRDIIINRKKNELFNRLKMQISAIAYQLPSIDIPDFHGQLIEIVKSNNNIRKNQNDLKHMLSGSITQEETYSVEI